MAASPFLCCAQARTSQVGEEETSGTPSVLRLIIKRSRNFPRTPAASTAAARRMLERTRRDGEMRMSRAPRPDEQIAARHVSK